MSRLLLTLMLVGSLSAPALAVDDPWGDDTPAPQPETRRRPVQAVAEDEPSVEISTDDIAPAAEEVELARPQRRPPARRQPAAASRPSAPASAEDSFGTRRIQVFLVPVGSTASLAAAEVQAALEGEVRRLPGFRPVDLVDALAVPPTPANAQRMEDARRAIADGNKLVLAHDYSEAITRYSTAIRYMEDAADALDAWSYADAWARLGVAFSYAGDDRKAKECLLMAARADLAGEVSGAQIDRQRGSQLEVAREEVASGGLGALSVVTSIPGARVFLGGVYKGITPVTIDRAPAGLNFVRIDRPGAYPVVRIAEVKEAYDTPLRVKLEFTPEALELQRTLQQVPRALDRVKNMPDMVAGLGTRFRLERAVVSTVLMEKTNMAKVRVAIFDIPRQARLVDESSVFAVDIEGGLQEAVANWARMVFDKADGAKDRDRNSKDPLSRSDGTENWYDASTTRSKTVKARLSEEEDDENTPEWERSNYEPKSYRNRSTISNDPLDHGDGTEDW